MRGVAGGVCRRVCNMAIHVSNYIQALFDLF